MENKPTGNPNGAIQAVSSAAATTLGLGIAFLGYWGFGQQAKDVPWDASHLLVLIPMGISFICLGYTPFIATRAIDEVRALVIARKSYISGIGLLLFAILMAFVPQAAAFL